MAVGLDGVRRVDLPGHLALHGVHPQPVRHLPRQVPGHLEADLVLAHEEVQEARHQDHHDRLDPVGSHHVPANVRMVSKHILFKACSNNSTE